MKCEHCGNNEVTFVYQSNINGAVTEKRLCGECAGKLGFTQRMAAQNQRMMRDFGNLLGGGFFDGFFSPMPGLLDRSGLLNRMGGLLEDPFDDFFADMPALGAVPARQEERQEKKEELMEPEEQERFSRQRQANALRMELREAVRREEFERAARLRDQLRALEESREEKREDHN